MGFHKILKCPVIPRCPPLSPRYPTLSPVIPRYPTLSRAIPTLSRVGFTCSFVPVYDFQVVCNNKKKDLKNVATIQNCTRGI